MFEGPKGRVLSEETEIAPTGSLQEVDTKQATTVKATTSAMVDPVSLERKVDDSAGLVQAQEKQLGPDVEAGEKLEDEETKRKKSPMRQPRLRLASIGIKRVIHSLVMDLDLELDDGDDGASSSGPLRWKRGRPSQWWNGSWYYGQWDQDSSSYGQRDWKEEDGWHCYGWSADQWIPPEKWEEGDLKQFYGEKLCRMLEYNEVPKEYICKITGVFWTHAEWTH